jgi:hypothetical protein
MRKLKLKDVKYQQGLDGKSELEPRPAPLGFYSLELKR